MKKCLALCACLGAMTFVWGGSQLWAAKAASGPSQLRVDDLATPLGLDDETPHFSWRIEDFEAGAAQSAYRIRVASTRERLAAGKADLWDSGKVESSQAINISYKGGKIQPSTRFFWTVTAWDAKGKEYKRQPVSWWESGLLRQEAWRAQWISWETAEEKAVRNSNAQWITSPDAAALIADKSTKEKHIVFRAPLALPKPVQRAVLYATCEDTFSAWINGVRIAEASSLPPYGQLPWKKLTRTDVTAAVTGKENILAVECVRYASGNSWGDPPVPPLMAALYVEYKQGGNAVFNLDSSAKTAINAQGDWRSAKYNDSQWKNAVVVPANQYAGKPWIPDSVKALRNDFVARHSVQSARLYATALGAYELYLNGKRVGKDVLAPGWTDYRERVLYQTYDVTRLLSPGANVLGALLAPGWYSSPLDIHQPPNNYGSLPPSLLAMLRIQYDNGEVEWVASSDAWKARSSYISSAEIYDGETQNERLDTAWQPAGLSGAGWSRADISRPPVLKVEAQDFQAISATKVLAPVAVTHPKPGLMIYDFEQNLAGVERIRVKGRSGTTIRVRTSEILNDDGTLYVTNLRTAKSTDTYTLSGRGIEELEPHFTYHGFRYIEVSGLSDQQEVQSVRAVALHTDAPFRLKLHTSNVLIQKIWENSVWSQRSNFISVPTDSPQRDERLGFSGDAQVFWGTAILNADLTAFSRKYAADLRGTLLKMGFYGIYAPGVAESSPPFATGWSEAGIVIPWTSWKYTGDVSIIDQNWEAMTKYEEQIANMNSEWVWESGYGIPFGDWLAPEGRTETVLVATAYWAYDVAMLQQMAHATGRFDEEKKYAEEFKNISEAFCKQFVREDGYIAGAEKGKTPFAHLGPPLLPSTGGDTQTGYVLALHMNLLPESLRKAAADHLAAKIEENHGRMATGFLGTPYLLEELTKNGHADLAYKLLLSTEFPSWGYEVRHGATTIWENWNGDQTKANPEMNSSFNHYAYGSVSEWLYRYAAGIDASAEDPGFHTVVLHPHFDEKLGDLSVDFNSSYGVIHSEWRAKQNQAVWSLTLPANTEGWIAAKQAQSLMLNGAPLAKSKRATPKRLSGEDGYVLQAGMYQFKAQY